MHYWIVNCESNKSINPFSRWSVGKENAHIDVHLLCGREHESQAPLQRIDLGPRVRLVAFKRLSHDQFIFGGGKYAFVYEEREEGVKEPWKVVLIDEKLGLHELEKMTRRQRKVKSS